MFEYQVGYVRKQSVNDSNPIGWMPIKAENKGEARKLFLAKPPKDFNAQSLIIKVVKIGEAE